MGRVCYGPRCPVTYFLNKHGRHYMLSFLSSFPVSVKRILDNEANEFYNKGH